jgi:hypothetical protein
MLIDKFFKLILSLAVAGLLSFCSGCKQEAKPPAPLPLAEMPAALTKVFAQAAPGVKDIVASVSAALQQKDLPAAYEGVKILCSLREATDDQRLIATRSMLTLTSELQTAQANGDKAAAAALQAHRSSK